MYFSWNLLPHTLTSDRGNSSTRNLKRGDEINFSFPPSPPHYNSIFFRFFKFHFYFTVISLLFLSFFVLKKLLHHHVAFLEATESRIFSCSLHCCGNDINCFTISIDNEFTVDGDVVCSISDCCSRKYGNRSWRSYSSSSTLCSNHGMIFDLKGSFMYAIISFS